MNRLGLTLFIAAGLAAAPLITRADDSETTTDVRCLVVTLAMSGSSDKLQQSVAIPAALYFSGRLDGKDQKFDLENALMTEAGKMTAEDIRSTAETCSAMLAANSARFHKIAEDFRRRASQTPEPPSPS